jgi:type II secretory pathway pseudopilin PulG
MRHRLQIRRRKRRDSGYALLLIMFFLALLVISMAAAGPTVLSSVQREREAEMVWRGKQYTRGIRMYYMKMQRFPTSLDDLTKPKTGIRFMRQAYKDPMNQVDGSWRLIYVGPNGQLIGSLSDRSLTLNGIGGATVGGTQASGSPFSSGNSLTNTNTGGFGSSSFGSSSFGSSSFGSSSFGSNQAGAAAQNGAAGTGPGGNNAAPGAPGANGTDGTTSTDDPLQPHSLVGAMDASNTIGGNIIGVGSKVNKKSFRIYEHAKNYRQFEFIWDPSKDTTVGRASAGIGTPIQNGAGMSPAGSSTPNSPFSSSPNPGQNINQPSQNPSQNQNPGGMGSDPSTPLQAPPSQ